MQVLKRAGNGLGKLQGGRAVFVCYGIWYAVMVATYGSPRPGIWLTALGMGLIVGLGFVFSGMTSLSNAGGGYWPVIRIFLIPFCVSSFSSIATSRGFLLIFAPSASTNLLAATGCLLFLALWIGARWGRAH